MSSTADVSWPDGPRRRNPSALFWNGYALGYDIAWDSPITTKAAEIVAHELSATHGLTDKMIVDFGCGTGLFAAELTARGATVTGTDRSRGMLKRAIRYGRIASAIQVDITETGMPDGYADFVICANVLHLHPNPTAVIVEAVRLVRSGGRIALVTPTEAATHHQVVREDRASHRGRWRTLFADLVRRQVSLASTFSDVRITPPSRLVEIIDRSITAHRLDVAVDRLIGRTQRIVILERIK